MVPYSSGILESEQSWAEDSLKLGWKNPSGKKREDKLQEGLEREWEMLWDFSI